MDAVPHKWIELKPAERMNGIIFCTFTIGDAYKCESICAGAEEGADEEEEEDDEEDEEE
jgi:hypothetical protein